MEPTEEQKKTMQAIYDDLVAVCRKYQENDLVEAAALVINAVEAFYYAFKMQSSELISLVKEEIERRESKKNHE